MDLPVAWVSVTTDLEHLREHERRRGDRIPGFAEGQVEQMFKEGRRDFGIDSGKMTTPEEAAEILRRIGLQG